MSMWLQILLDGMGQAVSWMKEVEVFVGVSLWSFILTVMIQGIVITALVNVVKSRVGLVSWRRGYSRGRADQRNESEK